MIGSTQVTIATLLKKLHPRNLGRQQVRQDETQHKLQRDGDDREQQRVPQHQPKNLAPEKAREVLKPNVAHRVRS